MAHEKQGRDGAVKGVFQGSARGFGFVTPEGGEARRDDFFIPPGQTGAAWDGDTVLILPDGIGVEDGDRRTAAVVSVVERKNKTVTGVVQRIGRDLWLRPDSDRLRESIRLTGKAHGARPGEKAAVEMQSYGSTKQPPTGILRETFGREGSRSAAVAAVLYNYEIDTEFPPVVLDEAERAPHEVEPAALDRRTDLRDKCIITIDGASAKDLDDAVSLERDGDGRWILGVHIADVSHYVAEKSQLDLEAWERGTSVYFADRVIPMLPTALSNGICSLNARVDRLTLSCIMTLSKDGEIVDHKVCKSVIRTAERMTYEDCNILLADPSSAPDLAERYANILPMLRDMAVLARALEKKRRARGSLDLDSSESYILCDEAGRPVGVQTRKQGVSEALIESFMLAANETVARHLFERSKPGVYRVHDKPSLDKTEGLKTMLAPFGYSLLEVDGFALQKVLDDARDKPEAPIISNIVLRSLMKARYDVQNLGHFGLAAKFYCHFTSPIRRYPDLMVHRILTMVIDAGDTTATSPWEKKMATVAQRAAVQSSERELAAQNAEREIVKIYMAEYMADHVGEEFAGAVSGVTKFGLFIMLPSGVEGFLGVESLPADHWHHDEEHMALRGEHTGARFTYGMAIQVLCAAAEIGSGRIDFALADGGEYKPRAARRDVPVRSVAPPSHKGGKRGIYKTKPPRRKPGPGKH